jgi:hypothetical protein
LWVEQGVTQAIGLVNEVAQLYQAYSYEREGKQWAGGTVARQASEDLAITAVRFLNAQGQECQTFQTGAAMTVEIEYIAHRPVSNPEFGVAIFRQDGVHVNGPNTKLAGIDLGILEGPGIVRYQIERLPLLPARYQVSAAVHDGRTHFCYDYHNQAYAFHVLPGGTTELEGLVAMPAIWTYENIQSVVAEQLYDEPVLL